FNRKGRQECAKNAKKGSRSRIFGTSVSGPHFQNTRMTEPNKPMVIGALPEGARDQVSAAQAVRQMFSAIAPRYDLLNHVLSLNIDRIWWRRTARRFAAILARRDAQVLDLCCGTGDMAFALQRQAGNSGAKIWGADFAHPMLERAVRKSQGAAPMWV